MFRYSIIIYPNTKWLNPRVFLFFFFFFFPPHVCKFKKKVECDFRISKVPAADHPEGAVREIFGYRAAYPRWLGYGRGTTYEPENTDFEIYPWKVR
jgi:hypothetical protein